tara:strand:+ start:1785 stop:1976 length:192 start_codon:yes stop_codon:yes gene_type:complete
MMSEFEVTMVAEVETTEILIALSEEEAFEAAYTKLLTEVQQKTSIDSIEITNYEIKRNENGIH